MAAIITQASKLIAILVLVGSAALCQATNGGDLNSTDDQGLRQGYWIIKGYMLSVENYGPNATIEEGHYQDSKKEGLWKKYWPEGTIKVEITYVHNRPIGPYKVYYQNGQLEEQGIWETNKNIGEFKRYHANGNPQQEFYFSDSGKRNGIQRYFHENGKVALEVNIINGKESGVLKRYNENGSLREEMVLNNGTLVEGSIKKSNSRGPEGASRTTPAQIHIEPEPNAPESQFTSDSPNAAHEFKSNGHNILYNGDQQVTQIGEFKNGRLWNGKWYRYNNEGILIRVEVYKSSKFIGTGVIEEE
jgi:antitoxin component YwqK of YwqJK toxin-antitoxin module